MTTGAASHLGVGTARAAGAGVGALAVMKGRGTHAICKRSGAFAENLKAAAMQSCLRLGIRMGHGRQASRDPPFTCGLGHTLALVLALAPFFGAPVVFAGAALQMSAARARLERAQRVAREQRHRRRGTIAGTIQPAPYASEDSSGSRTADVPCLAAALGVAVLLVAGLGLGLALRAGGKGQGSCSCQQQLAGQFNIIMS